MREKATNEPTVTATTSRHHLAREHTKKSPTPEFREPRAHLCADRFANLSLPRLWFLFFFLGPLTPTPHTAGGFRFPFFRSSL